MKANELRIGNLVNPKTICSILSIYGVGNYVCDIEFCHNGNEHDGAFAQIAVDQLAPIPITEDWLIKFGFEYVANEDDGGSMIMKTYEKGEIQFTYEGEGFVYYEKPWSDVQLNYVHELQNLYFALTDEELTI